MEKEINILIKKAMGNRTIEQFAKDCNLSITLLTQVEHNSKLITLDILKKIAKNAQNNVTYTDLVMAAGYITKNEMNGHKFINPDELVDPKGLKKIENIGIAFFDGIKEVSPEDIDTIIEFIQNKRKMEEKYKQKYEEE